MSEAVIRRADQGDLAGLLGLYRHLNPDDPVPEQQRAEAAWSALLDSGPATVFVADEGGMLVASCTLVMVPNLTRGVRPWGVIENVVTHVAHRRRGLGRSVLTAALHAAWEAGCYKVMLATGSRRPETLAFYERAGFVRGKTAFEIRRV